MPKRFSAALYPMNRIGFGSDIHRLEPGRPLKLGGVTIESDLGAVGHSDADALLHAVTDALLGALALGDIGSHFPNSDERWRDADSSVFLAHAAELVAGQGFAISNVDSVISLERPKLRPFIDEMRDNISRLLGIGREQVSIKAKTGEGVDSVGEMRAVRAEAIVLIHKL